MISIIIPFHNAEQYLEETLRSVLQQTYTDYEVLLIDDASTDRSAAIAAEWVKKDERFRLMSTSCPDDKSVMVTGTITDTCPDDRPVMVTGTITGLPSGVAGARNLGVREARGEWIAFVDSDDLWTTDKLEKQMKFIHSGNPQAGTAPQFVFTGSSFIDEASRPVASILHVPGCIRFRELLNQNVISCSSVLIRRELMLQHPMPDGDFHEDFATWLTILRDGVEAYGIDEPLLIYRLHQNSASRSSNKWKAALRNFRVYHYAGVYFPMDLYHWIIYVWRSLHKYQKLR